MDVHGAGATEQHIMNMGHHEPPSNLHQIPLRFITVLNLPSFSLAHKLILAWWPAALPDDAPTINALTMLVEFVGARTTRLTVPATSELLRIQVPATTQGLNF